MINEEHQNLCDSYSKILGSYSPDIMKVCINTVHDDRNTLQNKRVFFYEQYHYWQSIFTPFGMAL